MLDLEPDGLKKLAKDDKIVEEYEKELEELNEKEEFKSIMTQEEQAAWLMEGFKYDARKEGIKQGIKQGRKEIIDILKSKNMLDEEISKLLDIDINK